MKIRKPTVERSRESLESLRERTDEWMRTLDRAKAIAKPFHAIYARNENWYVGRNDNGGDDADRFRIPHLDVISEIMSGPGEYRVIVNRLMAIIAGQISELAYRNPYGRLRSLSPLGSASASMRIAEYIMNYVAKSEENELEDVLEDVLLNAFMGLGTLEAVYEPENRTFDEDEREAYGEIEFDDDGTFDVIGGTPQEGEDQNLAGDGAKIKLETVQLGDLFQLRSRHWLDLLFDPEGGPSFRDHRFVADRVVYRLEEFQKDRMFTNKQDIEMAAKHIDDVFGPHLEQLSTVVHRRQYIAAAIRRGEKVDDDGLRLFGWRIIDIKNARTIVVIEDHDRLVYDQPSPSWVARSKHPYSFLSFLRRPGEWYPLTEVENWIPTGEMYNQLLGLKLRHTKRFLRKYQTLKGAFDDDELEKAKSHEDGEVLQYNDPGARLEPIADAPFDPSIMNDIAIAVRDGNEMMSSSSESRADAAADTATAVAVMEGHSGLRRDRKKARLARAVGRAWTKLLRAIQTNLPEGFSMLTTGPNGETIELRPTRPMIQGDFTVYVEVHELGTPDIDKQLNRLNQAIALWGPIVWQIPEFTKPYVELLLAGQPQVADAIVAKFQQMQQMQLQQAQASTQAGPQRAGGGGGQSVVPMQRRISPDAGKGAGSGAGAGGGRQYGRQVRPGA